MGQSLACSRSSDEHEFFNAVQSGDLESIEYILCADPSLLRGATIYDRLSAAHIAAANGRLRCEEACEFAHGVFECWLHSARYRTQPSKDGTACRRRVCFFAHTPSQLRVLPPHHASLRGGAGPGNAVAAAAAYVESYDGLPLRHRAVETAYLAKGLMSSSPMSTLMSPSVSPPSESPPMSPGAAAAVRRASWPAVDDFVASLR